MSEHQAIPSQRHLFDIPEGISYLNCAYMSALLKAVAAAGRRAPHYVGLRFPRGVPADLPQRLAADRVYASMRGRSALRVTPHVYNTESDIDRLIRAIGIVRS